ncbi:hypothetical protein KFK09_009369 [Dendrobium nobile]|uniref:Uncharacterized protein n=1 Tax=Dendrobium nobile TaxID=94219 RepID=A0A8T3BJ80_DENNO|nr:hypothetical protein KFK09_009369 [Dendrobium nobile]
MLRLVLWINSVNWEGVLHWMMGGLIGGGSRMRVKSLVVEIIMSESGLGTRFVLRRTLIGMNPDWDDDRKSSPELRSSSQMEIFEQKSLDETVFTDIDAQTQNKKLKTNVEARCDKERKMREWWKEEYFAEISKRGKNSKGLKWFRNNKLGEMDISFRKGWKKRKNQ